jgi:uncharacterized protein (TIGR00290 family)
MILSPKAAISWSAGKDGCLALLRARESGLNVHSFVTLCEADGISKSHALLPALIDAQVARFGALWMPVRVTGSYGELFSRTLEGLVVSGHTHMVFGDIDLQAHRDWLEPACARAGLEAVFPLWREPRRELAAEIISRGIRACVVGVDTSRLDASFCGADYDDDFLSRLPSGVCPCGEDGEFHTFVYGAPGMSAPLAIERGARRLVPSTPPLRPTVLAFQELRLAARGADR